MSDNRRASTSRRTNQRKTESIGGTDMQKLIAILTGCCLMLAVSVQAAEPPPDQPATKVQPQKKNAPKQQVAPKQPQARTMPNTHAQTVHPQRPERSVHANMNVNVKTNVSKKPIRQQVVPAQP